MSYESPHDLERSVGYETSQLSSVGLMSPSRLAEANAQLQSTQRVKRWLTASVAGILSVGALGVLHETSKARVESYTAIEVATPPSRATTTTKLAPTTLKPRPETKAAPTTIKKVSPTTLPPATTLAPKPLAAASAPISTPNLQIIQYDIAWPQCKAAKTNPDPLPSSPEVIVQSTGGQFDEKSPCLPQEATNNGHSTMFYFMAGATATNAYQSMYKYMHDNIKFVESSVPGPYKFWLDVELGKNDRGEELWTNDINTNIQGIEGAQHAIADEQAATGGLVSEGGIYSNLGFWHKIAGNWKPNMPMWYTTGQTSKNAALTYCNNPEWAFTNGPWALVQYQPTPALDMDVACPPPATTSQPTATSH